MPVRDLDLIAAHLARHDPVVHRPGSHAEAAVARGLHQPPGGVPELLFIQRAQTPGDPWSGQMALPGGRRDPGDPDLAATAARETLEEVGVPLPGPLGRLDDFSGSRRHVRPIVVSPFVYRVDERPRVTPNYEVRDTVWVPLPVLVDPTAAVHYEFRRDVPEGRFPAFHYAGYTVWGLTYRVLGNFLRVLGRDYPELDLNRVVRDDNSQ